MRFDGIASTRSLCFRQHFRMMSSEIPVEGMQGCKPLISSAHMGYYVWSRIIRRKSRTRSGDRSSRINTV